MQNEAGIFLLKHAYYLRIVLDYYTTALNFKIRSAHKFYFKTFLTTQAKGFLGENGSNLLKNSRSFVPGFNSLLHTQSVKNSE